MTEAPQMKEHSDINLIHSNESCAQCAPIQFDIYGQVFCVFEFTDFFAMIPRKYSGSGSYKEHRRQCRSNTPYFCSKKIPRDTMARHRNKRMMMNMDPTISRPMIILQKTCLSPFKRTFHYWWLQELNYLGNRIFRSQGTPSLFNILGDWRHQTYLTNLWTLF